MSFNYDTLDCLELKFSGLMTMAGWLSHWDYAGRSRRHIRSLLGSVTPGALFGKQCEGLGRVVRTLFVGGHSEMELYFLLSFDGLCSPGRGRSPKFSMASASLYFLANSRVAQQSISLRIRDQSGEYSLARLLA